MKLLLDQPVVGLEGEPIALNGKPAPKMFHFVAEILAKSQATQPLRSYELALKFYSGVAVELGDDDFKFVRDTVEGSAFWPLIRGAILKELDGQKLAATAGKATQ